MMMSILAEACRMMHDMDDRRESWKEQIKRGWIESAKLPRKKKRRKELLIDYSIASYDLFDLNL